MGDDQAIRVLIVEDDPMVAEVNRQMVERIGGYAVIGSESDPLRLLKYIQVERPRLILLDLFLPKMNGLEFLRELRQKAFSIDVIVISAAKETEALRRALQLGAVDYLIKPFTFTRLKKALERYRHYVRVEHHAEVSQYIIDHLLNYPVGKDAYQDGNKNGYKEGNLLVHGECAETRPWHIADLPKGLNQETLAKVYQYLSTINTFVSAEEAARELGMSRVTVRRYLEYLLELKLVTLKPQYGSVGRPQNLYKIAKIGE
ncbi:MAG: response regulator [Candidatus Carbobacillus altaicus]|nr:response regulator [Candidatus Carbobacillus altaicus]